jgi:hypothetical protein
VLCDVPLAFRAREPLKWDGYTPRGRGLRCPVDKRDEDAGVRSTAGVDVESGRARGPCNCGSGAVMACNGL